MPIRLKRVYEPASPDDGCRILVERLWPRGLSKREARVDWWARDCAPSAELRRWFAHDAGKWKEFCRRYHAELRANPEALAPLLERVRAGTVTFVFASRETRHNNAVALKAWIERRC